VAIEVSFELLIVSAAINGFAYGMLLFIFASGLSIVFGLMDVLNFAHGAFFMVGTYLVCSAFAVTHNFVLSLVFVLAVGTAIGAVTELTLLRPLYGRPIFQILLTLGLFFVIDQMVLSLWGPLGLDVGPDEVGVPQVLSVLGAGVYLYNVLLIGAGIATATVLYLFLNKTNIGTKVRAGSESRELAETFGINIKALGTAIFGLGTGLAFFAGGLAEPWVGASLATSTDFLLLGFIVVVVGGMGSFTGSFFGAIVIGLVYQFSAYFFPQLTFVSDLLIMIVVLILRPSGLFGKGKS
jgi:branched-chain amino acid transport system permease protein